jgi:hypothetical protein
MKPMNVSQLDARGPENWREEAARLRYERAVDDDEGRVAWHDTVESVRHLYRSEVNEFLEGSAVDAARGSSIPEQPGDARDTLYDFSEEALVELKELVDPLEDMPQSDRLLRLVENALEAKRR